MRQDIQLTAIDGDLQIGFNGDFIISYDSNDQHIYDILNDSKGEWFQFPNIGLGLALYQYGPADASKLQRDIKMQLGSDGYSCSPIVRFNYSTGAMDINPQATKQ